MSETNIIEVSGLTKDFGHGRGIFDISLKVNKGETLGFLGPNGAGKTTTIRHLLGFTNPGSGSCKILGYDCFNEKCEIMKHVGYLPGEVNFPDGLNAKQFLDMLIELKDVKENNRMEELLNLFPIDLDMISKKMSVGGKRKLAVIATFLSDPDILIMDEPSSGLDPLMQERFIEFILEEKKKGKTILLSSHMFDEVGALCDRISIIKEGRIIKELTAKEIKRPVDKTYEITFSNNEELSAFRKETFSFQKSKETNAIRIVVKDKDINLMTSVLSKYKIANLEEIGFDLEKYFLNFYKSDRKFGGV